MGQRVLVVLAWMSAFAGVARAHGAAVAESTATAHVKEVLQEAADLSGNGARSVFDGSRGSRVAAESVGGFFRAVARSAAAVPARGLKIPSVAAVREVLSDRPGSKQCCLDTLQNSADGKLYRMRADRPWWRVWDSAKVIEQAKPGRDGALYNKKGEFVGDWESVLRTKKADGFKVVAEQGGGKNAVYTFVKGKGGTEVGRNGKYVTTLGGDDLREIKIGADDKIYARFEKGRADAIVRIDPVSRQQTEVAKVDALYKRSDHWHQERGHYHEHGHYVERPGWREDKPGYYHPHEGSPGRYETVRKPGYYHPHEGQPGYYETVQKPGNYHPHEGSPGYYDGRGYWREGTPDYDHWHNGGSEQVWRPGTPGENHWHEGDSEQVWRPGTPGENHWHEGESVWHPPYQEWLVDQNHWHVDEPARNHEHVDRRGLAKFEVDAKGEVYTLLDGQITAQGTRRDLGSPGVQNFAVDSTGKVYAVRDGKLSVDGSPGTLPVSPDTPLRLDDAGNLIRADGSLIRRDTLAAAPPGALARR